MAVYPMGYDEIAQAHIKMAKVGEKIGYQLDNQAV